MLRLSIILVLLGLLKYSASDFAEYKVFLETNANNATLKALFEEHLKRIEEDDRNDKLNVGDTFHCSSLPKKEDATSVHKLTPMDISVVGAIGDSITAGFGADAKTIIGLLIESRGKSWDIGGQGNINQYQTIPNILKVYNSGVKGFSTGKGGVRSRNAKLNVAISGDKAGDILSQTNELVKRMKSDSNIDYEKDWKLITIFIGGNDLCDVCDNEEKYSAENYLKHVQESLDILHRDVPRAFVSVVEVLNITIVKTLNLNLFCNIVHIACRCGAFPANEQAEQKLNDVTREYRRLVDDLVESGRYDTRDDFTVVIQPFWRDTVPPNKEGTDEPDASYFAPDCFHLSLKGQGAAADALWNNLIQPVGQKETKWFPGEKVLCPTEEQPYFFTYKNSPPIPRSVSGLGSMLGARANKSNTDVKPKDATPGDSHPSSTVGIVVGSVGFVCFLALITLAIAFMTKRKRSQEDLLLSITRNKSKYEKI